MTNVVRFYHIYNFVATQLRERLSKMLVTPTYYHPASCKGWKDSI